MAQPTPRLPVLRPLRRGLRSSGGGPRTRVGRLLSPVLLASVVAAPGIGGQEPGPSAAAVETTRLANGLRLVVVERPSSALVAVSLQLPAGRVHEPDSLPGLASLVEGLVLHGAGLPGTDPGEAARRLAARGGAQAGEVDADRVVYHMVVPTSEVESALRMQAARMGELRPDPRAVEAVRASLEARRRALEGEPYARARLALDTLTRGVEPYRRSPLGAPEVLGSLGPEEVTRFHRRTHGPGGAVLAVVGGVETPRVEALVREILGTLEPGPSPAPDPTGPDPVAGPAPAPPPVERRVALDEPTASRPLVWMAWPAPPGDHPDLPALELLVAALGDGAAGRLSRRLVEGREVATDVTAALELRRGPGVVRLAARAGPGVPARRLVEALDRELARVRARGVEARELRGAYNRRRARAVEERLTVRGAADALLRSTLRRGRPASLEEELARYAGAGRREVAEVARRYLRPDLRTVVTVGGEG